VLTRTLPCIQRETARFQPTSHFIKADGRFVATLSDDGEVMQVLHHPAVFGKRNNDRLPFSMAVREVTALGSFLDAPRTPSLIIAD
jgi:hypothetical protein